MNRRNRWCSCKWAIPILVLAWCLMVSTNAMAQVGNGTLTGTIIDEQGGALPGALVTVTEQATGAIRTTNTNSEGVFRLPALPPGRFTLKITLDGFQPLEVTDISLSPTEVRDLPKLQLKVGQLTESVSVTAETAAV